MFHDTELGRLEHHRYTGEGGYEDHYPIEVGHQAEEVTLEQEKSGHVCDEVKMGTKCVKMIY